MKKKSCLVLSFALLMLLTNNVYAECTLEYTTCGSGANQVTDIPVFLPRLISYFVMFLQIIIPIVLIITGMLEMTKSVSSGNPDNIAKGRLKLIKKFVAALLAFLVITFTTNIIKLIADKTEAPTFVDCMSCYLNNKCGNTYCGDSSDKNGPYNPDGGGYQGGENYYTIEDLSGCYKLTEKKYCDGATDQYLNHCGWVDGKCVITKPMCIDQPQNICYAMEPLGCKWGKTTSHPEPYCTDLATWEIIGIK